MENEMKSLKCDCCGQDFFRKKSTWSVLKSLKKTKGCNHYCSKSCSYEAQGISIPLEVECLNCGNIFTKHMSQIKKSPNHFCCQTCATTYNNTHKTKGTRRSKLEVWLEEQLSTQYSNLEILYCDKSTINSELDIYIPSLNLAFELNGIFHYEAIFGEDKLNQIQNNDGRKFQACLEKGIELCIIDTSAQTYVKESTSKKYLDIINQVISLKTK